MSQEQGPSHSFVARVWLEPGPRREQVWRGHVRHVQSGEETYFHEIARMVAFMETITGVPLPPRGEPLDRQQGDASYKSPPGTGRTL